MKLVWNNRSIFLGSKIRLMRSFVTSIFLYACESWTLTTKLQRRIRAMEMRCYSKILRISRKEFVTYEEVCANNSAGNRITRRPSDHRKETQTEVVCTCLPFIRSGQNYFARHIERGNKRRQTEEEVERQHQGMDRPGVRQVPEGSGEQRKMEETGREIINSAPTTPRLRDR